MPQALVLMNSPFIGNILTSRTQLGHGLAMTTTLEEQAEAVFLTLLSRRPTETEMSTWKQAQAEGLDSIEDLVFALINSRQFLFIR